MYFLNKLICIGTICVLMPLFSSSQNVFSLNDSIKSLYSHEYSTVKLILKSLITKDTEEVSRLIEKDILLKSFDKISEKLSYGGMPEDSSIKVAYNNKPIDDVVYGGKIMLKNVFFEVAIADPEIESFNNVLSFNFFTDKEVDFNAKTHDYELNRVVFIPATWYKGRADLIYGIKNYNLDSLSNVTDSLFKSSSVINL